jgi:hypothetical protein
MLPSTSIRDVTSTGWERHVAYMEDRKGYTGCWTEDLRKTAHSDNLRIDGKIIPKWIFQMWDG